MSYTCMQIIYIWCLANRLSTYLIFLFIFEIEVTDHDAKNILINVKSIYVDEFKIMMARLMQIIYFMYG